MFAVNASMKRKTTLHTRTVSSEGGGIRGGGQLAPEILRIETF